MVSALGFNLFPIGCIGLNTRCYTLVYMVSALGFKLFPIGCIGLIKWGSTVASTSGIMAGCY